MGDGEKTNEEFGESRELSLEQSRVLGVTRVRVQAKGRRVGSDGTWANVMG